MYYVYVGRIYGDIVYVGKGKEDRDLHLNSGCSNIYEANKWHFSGGSIEVSRVVEGLEELDAFELETHLIREIAPIWNKIMVPNSRKKSIATSEYLGVSFYKSKPAKPWRAWYKLDGDKKHIGYFETELEAVEARDKLLQERGITGRMNSPET